MEKNLNKDQNMKNPNLLLLHPPIPSQCPFHPNYIPLRLASIASTIKTGGFDVEILDMNALKMNINEVDNFIGKLQPSVVGISFFAHNYLEACKLAEVAKKHGCLVVMTGLHATFTANILLYENPFVDVVIRGEEEQTMFEIMASFIGGGELKRIRGITYRSDNGTICANPDRELIIDLDSLPTPALDLLPIEKYKAIPILASRGCAANCIYCPYSAFWRHTLRIRSPQSVLEEIKQHTQRYRKREVEFLDNLFVFSGWGDQLFGLLKKNKMDIDWSCSTRIDAVDEKTLRKAAEVGCKEITFGIETLSMKTQRRIKKSLNIEQLGNIIKLAHKYCIRVKLNFIIGLPGQTEEEILDCISLVKELKPEKVGLNVLTPYPGTEITEKLEHYKVSFNHKDWWKFDEKRYSIHTDKLSYDKINFLFLKFIEELSNIGISYSNGY